MAAWVAKSDAAQQASEKSQRGGHSGLKKIKEKVGELQKEIHNHYGNCGKVRLMFQDINSVGRDFNRDFVVQSHPALTEGFVTTVRQEYQLSLPQ